MHGRYERWSQVVFRGERVFAACFDSWYEIDVATLYVIELHMQEPVIAGVECINSGGIRFLKAIITPVLSAVSGLSDCDVEQNVSEECHNSCSEEQIGDLYYRRRIVEEFGQLEPVLSAICHGLADISFRSTAVVGHLKLVSVSECTADIPARQFFCC